MRTNIPAFRLPANVLDEEIGYIVDMGADLRLNTPVKSMRQLLESKEFDAVFVGPARPRARNSNCRAGTTRIASISASPGSSRLPSAMSRNGRESLDHRRRQHGDGCCRSSLRSGAKDVKVMARKPRRVLQGVRLGARGCRARKRRHRGQPCAQVLRHRGWPARGHDVRETRIRLETATSRLRARSARSSSPATM